MKILFFLLSFAFPTVSLLAQSKYPQPDTLFKICLDEEQEPEGTLFPTCGYVNRQGDTVIPLGTYEGIMGGDFVHFVPVFLKSTGENDLLSTQGPYAVDRAGKILFKMFWFDNGPDYFSDGLVRIVENGLIGYADETGKIVIKPQYGCAYPFENGTAQVGHDCDKIWMDDEHWSWATEIWLTIDKQGQIVQE